VRLKGKVAIVTGARRGIGKAVALALAKEGADLVLVSKNLQEEDVVVQEVKDLGRKVLVKRVDVGEKEQVEAMVEEAAAFFPRIDILFNNAGVCKTAMLWKLTPEEWDEVIRVNLSGTFFCLQAVSKIMMSQESGSIINVTSSEALLGTIGQVNYAAAKGGVHALTKSAAKELARFGIRVNTIAPMADTDMTKLIAHDPRFKDKYLERMPLGRFARPEEIGPAIVFLASDESSFITGQTIGIDGGMVML